MKTFKQLLFMAVLVIGFSMTAMAQKDDNQNRPVKPDPPKIDPKDKPKDRPKDNGNSNRPKKPQEAIFVSRTQSETGLV